jgi:hypothetical protein
MPWPTISTCALMRCESRLQQTFCVGLFLLAYLLCHCHGVWAFGCSNPRHTSGLCLSERTGFRYCSNKRVVLRLRRRRGDEKFLFLLSDENFPRICPIERANIISQFQCFASIDSFCNHQFHKRHAPHTRKMPKLDNTTETNRESQTGNRTMIRHRRGRELHPWLRRNSL